MAEKDVMERIKELHLELARLTELLWAAKVAESPEARRILLKEVFHSLEGEIQGYKQWLSRQKNR